MFYNTSACEDITLNNIRQFKYLGTQDTMIIDVILGWSLEINSGGKYLLSDSTILLLTSEFLLCSRKLRFIERLSFQCFCMRVTLGFRRFQMQNAGLSKFRFIGKCGDRYEIVRKGSV